MTKKGQESPVKEQNCRFLPVIFANTGHLERCTPLNDVFFFFELLILIFNKANYTKLFKSMLYYIIRTHLI